MTNDLKNISMRDVFWNKVYELARKDSNIVVVSADMGAPALDKFRKDLGSQFVNVGIAEQNAVLLSAGLALERKKVFVYAIAPFITLRCYEQTRVNLAGMNLAVTLVGVGAGFGYDDSGPTHHALEDLSIMRILPNLTVNNITDSQMAAAFADISYRMKSPNYVRLAREALPNVYQEGDDFSKGLTVLKEGKDICIVATGNMVHRALEVAEDLKKYNVTAKVIDLYTFPINEKMFLEAIEDAQKIVTIEEHTLPGGMGGAVAEVLADNQKFIPLKRIGLDLRKGYCYKYGGRESIRSLLGLDKDSIVKAILDLKQ